jgi:hypothetical protein
MALHPPSGPAGPGSPQNRPLAPDAEGLSGLLPDAVQPPGPAPIDMSAPGLRDGLNPCPRCGATEVRHRAGTDRLICLYCRHEWAAARVEEAFGLGTGIAELQGTQRAAGARDIAADARDLRSYRCAGCGAEVVINTLGSLTARCHWCRHVLGVNEQIDNGAVPDAVLPFRVRQEDAVERIRRFVDARRLFALESFKEQFSPENVVGVYLPYMVVDARGSADAAGVGEIETRRYTRGKDKDKQTYYDADVWRVHRHVDFTVDDLAVESSAHRSHMDARTNTHNVINSILPFDTKNAVQWNASYLVGYTSEKRDLDVQQLMPRVQEKMLTIARARMQPSVSRYDRGVRWEQERIDLKGTRWVAMYLPVWLYAHHQPGPNGGLRHYIAVNGRTGQTMGSVPVQKWKLLLAALTVGTVVEALALWFISR